MPGPGKTSGKVKQDTHRPNRTQIYLRQKRDDCLKSITPGQEFKCDPRYQPPSPQEMRGFISAPIYVLTVDRNGKLRRRKV